MMLKPLVAIRGLGWLLLSATAAVAAPGCGPAAPSNYGPQDLTDLPEASSPVVDTTSEPTGQWPHWRGPHEDGRSRETGLLDTFPAEGPQKLWSQPIGIGYSSMAVANARVFAMGHVRGEDVVSCLDAKSGQRLWTHKYKAELVDNLHQGGPGATPTYADGDLYTLSREGHLLCLNAETGKPKWLVHARNDLGLKRPEWGFTSSPYVLGKLVIVDLGRVVAVDRRTGRVAWQSSEQFPPGYGSAVSFEYQGRTFLAVLNNKALVLVNPTNGKVEGEYGWETQYQTTAATPIIKKDTIFISSGYGRGCALLKLAPGKIEKVYENKNMANHFNNSVLYQGKLYGISGNTHTRSQCRLTCIDHATGERHWFERGFGAGSLLIADDKLIVLSDRGELVLAKASPESYQELARGQVLDGECWTVPVLAGGRLYARNTAGTLVCVQMTE